MKYLYSWLKEHYSELSPLEKLENLLIQIGHDVESIEPILYEGIVVAEIQSVEKHPNADRLSLVTVTTGSSTYPVVCGAPGLQIGQKVAYASVGTHLPCGFTLKAAEIRGVASEGMLLAEDELAMGPSHDSLLPLPDDAVLGQPLKQYVPADAILSLDITSDRGDVLSHFGLARDLKAAIERKTLMPTFTVPEFTPNPPETIHIDTIHPDARALLFGLVESDTKAKTPLFMQARLDLLGQKSINLATDITNYLLLEYGKPLHAYDADCLPHPITFGVRRAHTQESFQGLNGRLFTLTPQALVVTASDSPVALAGVLGGESSKVTDTTKRVIFESAYFYPKPVRLMARGLNCLTDAAIRWERGVDYSLTEAVLLHAQALYQKVTEGKVYAPIKKENQAPAEAGTVTLAKNIWQKRLGTPIETNDVAAILRGLGCSVEVNQDELSVSPPSWRPDLAIAEDYYEEVIRMIGVHNLERKSLPASVPQWKRSKWWREESVKDILTGLGAMEIAFYPFMSQEEIALFPSSFPPVELQESVHEGKKYMRTSLIPGMLQAMAANPEAPTLQLFEMAKIYMPKQETTMLCIGAAGSNEHELDGWWQHLFERLHLPVASWMTRVQDMNESAKNAYKIRKTHVMVLTLPVGDLIQGKNYDNPTVIIPELDAVHYLPLSKYQASRRDIAFVVNQSHTNDQIIHDLKQLDPCIIDVELFDTYRDVKLGNDNLSLAYHLLYQAPDRTLTNDEIQQLHQKVTAYIEEHYHGTIR